MTSPSKFVNLHGHSTFSTWDAIGSPKDHIDFAIKNGADALALTDHGNMNGFAIQFAHAKKLQAKGINFKPIAGVEAYFIPSLKDWNELKQQRQEEKAAAKVALAMGNELAELETDLDEAAEEKKPKEEQEEEEEQGGTIVENEEETKTKRSKDPLNKRSHLVLLAKNSEGLKGIFSIVSETAKYGFYRFPRADYAMLEKYAKGNIIATSACLGGLLSNIIFDFQENPVWEQWGPNMDKFEEIQVALAKEISNFQAVLGKENFFLELQANRLLPQHLVNQHLIEASKRTGAPLVVTCDSHYSDPEHWKEREIYKLIGWQQRMKGKGVDLNDIPKSIDELKCELYPKNAEQVWKSYKDYGLSKFPDVYTPENEVLIKEAIERTHSIAHDLIGDVQIDRRVKLPRLETITGRPLNVSVESSDEEEALAVKELVDKAKKGLVKKGKASNQKYIDQLKHELEVVKLLGLSKYFLTCSKILELVMPYQLVGNGRGSATGSLLSYCLGITQVDPIKYNLLFARFLSRKKLGNADIDMDYADRDQVIELISKHFGEDNVIPVSNFAQLKLASLCKDLARLWSLPAEEVNEYTSKIFREALSKAKEEPGFDLTQWELTLEEAEEKSPTYREFIKRMEEYPEFSKALEILFKQQRTVSRHAGGVIITDDAVHNMPLIKAKNSLQTPWSEGLNGRYLEELGFLKFDILVIGTLRMFEKCIEKILINRFNISNPTFKQIKEFYDEHLHPDNNNFDDQEVYKNVFWNKNYASIFQFVKPNTQNFMKKMKPKNIVDVAVATSIFRPGPLGLDADKLYLKNRENKKLVHYVHPAVEEVLGPTEGLMIFQEQLQLIVHKLAGWDLDDTDAIRKNFTKKNKDKKKEQEEEREALKKRFVEGSVKTSGITEEQAEIVWKDFEAWSQYGFCAAHAIPYAMVSYCCAWLQTYFPEEWIPTTIDYATMEKGSTSTTDDPKLVAINDARKFFKIGKVDINNSEYETSYHKETKKLLPGFSTVKNVGKTALQEMKLFRPYRTVEDLLINNNGKWRHSKFNKKGLTHLIQLEALDSMGLVGEGKRFKNYRHLYNVLIPNMDSLKRISARKKNNDVAAALAELLVKTPPEDMVDWTDREKSEFQIKLFGVLLDTKLLLPDNVKEVIKKTGYDSLDHYTEDGPYWAIVKRCLVKETKNKDKKYLWMQVGGENGGTHAVNVFPEWGKKEVDSVPVGSVISGFFQYSEDYDNFKLNPKNMFVLNK